MAHARVGSMHLLELVAFDQVVQQGGFRLRLGPGAFRTNAHQLVKMVARWTLVHLVCRQNMRADDLHVGLAFQR